MPSEPDLVTTERAVAALAQASREAAGWPVRLAAINRLAGYAADSAVARQAIARATHDPVDLVAFAAIRLAGELGVREAIEQLIEIADWPSEFTRPEYHRMPIGVEAALAKRALLQLFGGLDQPTALLAAEDQHFAGLARAVAAQTRLCRPDDAVPIPAGPFIAGTVCPAEDDSFRMAADDNPARVVLLDGFWIDRFPVTNARYRKFIAEVGDAKDFAHPDEPPGKCYQPAHWSDPRFTADDQPVVGIDWYDAWAFAAWAGGSLPSEEQWEKAARGTDGRPYPWGEWLPGRANYVETAFGALPQDLAELESLLVQVSDRHPAEPLAPVDLHPEDQSPYGVRQSSGNVWEITRTNYFTGTDMAPLLRAYQPSDFLHRPEAFHVLRGGSWTCPPICLRTDYRGRGLLTDRHFDVGFRCVYPDREPLPG
ncbi:MAG TPA: SUMF1/EgtB/PvdO family nonheme iron enzyme [Jatrophihabitans sp.]|nr:SUMF1/EgtB/PvdO family nonheme iron enzyme [Jatrophihabitans sp.]